MRRHIVQRRILYEVSFLDLVLNKLLHHCNKNIQNKFIYISNIYGTSFKVHFVY